MYEDPILWSFDIPTRETNYEQYISGRWWILVKGVSAKEEQGERRDYIPFCLSGPLLSLNPSENGQKVIGGEIFPAIP
jgi:hypothetical protein